MSTKVKTTSTANMRSMLLLAIGTTAMLGTTHAGSSAASSAHPPIQAKEDGFQSPTDVSDVGVSNAPLHEDSAPLGAGTTITVGPLGATHRFDANGNTRSNADADASNVKGNGKISTAAENSGERNVPAWLPVPIEAADSTSLHNAPATPFAIVNEARKGAGKTNNGLNDNGA